MSAYGTRISEEARSAPSFRPCQELVIRPGAAPSASLLRDVLADVPSQDLVDEGLVPHTPSACFLAELIEYARIDSNRNELARFVAERGATDAPHRLQLLRR
jgi:hypothetical protein